MAARLALRRAARAVGPESDPFLDLVPGSAFPAVESTGGGA
jgi:hypothetical protein